MYAYLKNLFMVLNRHRAWYQRFADFIGTIGFHHSRSDHSLFVYRQNTDTAYILLYVDDIIITASSDSLHQTIMTQLANEFSMKDLGPLSSLLALMLIVHLLVFFLLRLHMLLN